MKFGTCWTVTRAGAVARCTLFASEDEWELRVFVNDEPLLWKRCRCAAEVSAVADDWRARLVDDGWTMTRPDGGPMPVRRNELAGP
jgi:hypothetical protein